MIARNVINRSNTCFPMFTVAKLKRAGNDMFIKGRLGKANVVYTHNQICQPESSKILLLATSQAGRYVEQNKPKSERQILAHCHSLWNLKC